MRITKIETENWRGTDLVELDNLEPTVLLLGPNGAGKSSILTAVQFALYERCFDVEGKRIPLGDLVRKGKTFARVCVRFMDKGKEYEVVAVIDARNGNASTTRHFGFLTGDKRDKVIAIRKRSIWDVTGLAYERAEVMGNPKAYLYSKELRQMLASMAAPGVDEKALSAFCDEQCDWFGEAINYYGMKTPKTVEELGVFGGHVHDDRRETKKKIAELRAQAKGKAAKKKGPLTPDGKELTVEDIPAIREQLSVLEGVLFDRNKELGKAQQGKESRRDPEVLKKSLASTAKKEYEAKQAMAESEAAREKASGELQDIRSRSSAQRGDMALVGDRVLADGDVCSKCGQEVSAKAAKRLAANKDKEAAVLTAIEVEAAKKAKQVALLDTIVEAFRAAYSQVAGDTQAVKNAIAETEKAAKEKPSRPLTEIKEEIAQATEQRTRGNEILEQLIRMQAASEVAEGDTSIEDLETELQHVEWAVKAFHDGEFIRLHCGSELAEFTAKVNGFLTGFGLAVEFDMKQGVTYLGPDLTTTVSGPVVARIPIAQCSKGEQCLAQCAVALAFGLDAPVIIDDLDGLSFENKHRVINALRMSVSSARESHAGSVLLAAAWGLKEQVEPAKLAKAMAPASVVWLDGGVVTSKG